MLKLGKKPARPGAIKLAFGSYFDKAKLPVPPRKFGHIWVQQPWLMLGNNFYSDCVFAGAAHETMVWGRMGNTSNVGPRFTEANVLSDYAAVTGFDPKKPDTDQGTDMQEAASYRRKTGVIDAEGKRHKIDAYVSLRPGNVSDLVTAVYVTGAAGVGIQFPDSAMEQFDKHHPWSVVKGPAPEGGHYVPCIGRNDEGNLLVVTWGRVQQMTPEFYSKYCDEAVAYLSLEALRGPKTIDGFDETALRSDLHLLAA